MAKETILIVDDEEDIVELIKYNLSMEGYSIFTALTGEEAVKIAGKIRPDLMVLDLMLPGIDGLEVTRRIRSGREAPDMPIVMLTAKGEESDIVIGLELGANDYISKPFSPRVLVARIRAILRRRNKSLADAPGGVIQEGALVIDRKRYRVTMEGDPLDLTPSEFALLSFLGEKKGWVFTRGQIVDRQFTCLLGGDLEKFHDVNQSCREIGENTGTRVTVILPSGVVVGDSQGAVMEMENHLGRPEIMEALKRKKGVSIRYSSTLDQDMMYIALPVIHDGGVIAVVRTSVSVSAIDNEIKSVGHNVLIAFFLTILAAAVISLYTTRRITRPVEEMRKGAAEFARGNLNARLVVPDSEELSKLAVTMNRMAENLDEKIKAVNSRSMELEAVHSSMEEGVIAVDGNEKIITINDAAAAAFGFSPSELKTGNILELSRNLELQSFFQRAMGTHDPVEDDITISGEGGDDLILNIHSTALYDAGGRRMGTLIIFHDITRIRRLEQMHKDFAANVSHELRTPLTTIKGFIETLQTMTAHNGVAETERFLKIIEKNVTRMIELIRDLLALAKLERLQGLDISFDRHNVAPLIQGAVHTCHPAIREKNITVTIDCPRDLSAAVDPV